MTQEEMLARAVEALEKAKADLEEITRQNADFTLTISSVSNSIEDVFERQKAIEQSIAKLDGAIEKLEGTLNRLSDLEQKIATLNAKLESLQGEELGKLVATLQEEASAALERINEGLKPVAPKKTSGAALKSIARKKK